MAKESKPARTKKNRLSVVSFKRSSLQLAAITVRPFIHCGVRSLSVINDHELLKVEGAEELGAKSPIRDFALYLPENLEGLVEVETIQYLPEGSSKWAEAILVDAKSGMKIKIADSLAIRLIRLAKKRSSGGKKR